MLLFKKQISTIALKTFAEFYRKSKINNFYSKQVFLNFETILLSLLDKKSLSRDIAIEIFFKHLIAYDHEDDIFAKNIVAFYVRINRPLKK